MGHECQVGCQMAECACPVKGLLFHVSPGDDSPTPSSESTELSDPTEKAAVTSQKHHCTYHQRQK